VAVRRGPRADASFPGNVLDVSLQSLGSLPGPCGAPVSGGIAEVRVRRGLAPRAAVPSSHRDARAEEPARLAGCLPLWTRSSATFACMLVVFHTQDKHFFPTTDKFTASVLEMVA